MNHTTRFSIPRSKRFRSIGLSAGLGAFFASFHHCCARPNFRAAKRRKMPERAEKPTETLVRQAIVFRVCIAGYSCFLFKNFEASISLIVHMTSGSKES